MTMDCNRVQGELSALIDGELPTAAAREVEVHLTGCTACREVHDLLAETRASFRLLDPSPRRVVAEVPPLSGRRSRAPWSWIPAAAAVAAGLGWLLLAHDPAPAPPGAPWGIAAGSEVYAASIMEPKEDPGASYGLDCRIETLDPGVIGMDLGLEGSAGI